MDLRLYNFKKIIIVTIVIITLIVAALIPIPYIKAKKVEEKAYEKKVKALELELQEAKDERALLPTQVVSYKSGDIFDLDLTQPSGATEEDLKKVLKQGMKGLEGTFLEAEKNYNVNAIFLISIAALESAWGTETFRPNNMFGYGNKGYASKADCIMDVASGLGNRYLKENGGLYGGSKTIRGVHKRYASSSTWDDKVGKNMVKIYEQINAGKDEIINQDLAEADAKIEKLTIKLENFKKEKP